LHACCVSCVYSDQLGRNVVRPWRLRGLPDTLVITVIEFYLSSCVHYWLFFFSFCNKVFFDSLLAALPLLQRFCCWITNIWLILNTCEVHFATMGSQTWMHIYNHEATHQSAWLGQPLNNADTRRTVKGACHSTLLITFHRGFACWISRLFHWSHAIRKAHKQIL